MLSAHPTIRSRCCSVEVQGARDRRGSSVSNGNSGEFSFWGGDFWASFSVKFFSKLLCVRVCVDNFNFN